MCDDSFQRMDTHLTDVEDRDTIIRLSPSFFQALYYFCAFADLGHFGIISICRNENCFCLDVTENI